MKKLIFFLFATLLMNLGLQAQVFSTGTGTIKFFSKTSAEDIDATNNLVKAALDAASGNLEYAVSVNNFIFKKTLMQKHFQENYMESGKFPKSTFKGNIINNSSVDYKKDGTYPVTAKGKLTMHGVTKDVTVPGKITIAGTKAVLKADFNVNLDDYNIKVPANNASQVAKTIKVSMDCSLVKK